MNMLKNPYVALCLDERWPRIAWYASPGGKTRLPGEREAVAPRVYVHRARDRAMLTSDDDAVRVAYACRFAEREAIYTAKVSCDGRPAAEFEVRIRLTGADATIRLQHVREFNGYYLLTVRFQRVVSASSRDPDARVVTCGLQGRVLDPGKCKPNMIDYSWHGTVARHCGAAYRPSCMVTIDVPGYDDLFVQEVRQLSRIGYAETLASLGAELMYRQRTVESPAPQIKVYPAPAKTPPVVPPKPILCADHKEIRLHFITAGRGQSLDWTGAARYFQSLVPAKIRCKPQYNGTLIYKIVLAHRHRPYLTFDQALDIIRKMYHLTGGLKQVCYLAYFQHEGGETGYPDMFTIYPPLGDKAMLRRVIREARKYNAVVSFHQNLDVFDARAPAFDPHYVARDSLGRMFSAGYWHPTQLLAISMPAYREHFAKHIRRLVKEYGIRETYHLDTFSGGAYIYDANPRRPFNATQFQQGKFAILKEFNRHGIDVTSENLMDLYVGRIGHTWSLFNGGTVWEGEEAIPFANFIYHGATSWNAGHGNCESAGSDAAMLESLVQAGGAGGVEFPIGTFNPAEARIVVDLNPWPQVLDKLYLIHPPYMLLRNRKWTGFTKKGSVRRVDYASARLGQGGPGSYIEVDDAKPGYTVVVDGQLIARDFATVFPGPRKGTYLAFSRTDRKLDWPAPKGWRSGVVPAAELTETGPGVKVAARVAKGRLALTLQAHRPILLSPAQCGLCPQPKKTNH